MCCSCYDLTASKIFFLITLAAPSLVYLVFPQNPIYQRNCFRTHTLSVTRQLTHRKVVNLNLPKSISWNLFRDTCASTIPGQTLHTSSFTPTIYFLQTFCTVFYEYAQIVCQQSSVFILLPFCLLGILQPFHLPPGTTARLPLSVCPCWTRTADAVGCSDRLPGWVQYFCSGNHSWKPRLETLLHQHLPKRCTFLILHTKCLSVQISWSCFCNWNLEKCKFPQKKFILPVCRAGIETQWLSW